MIGINELDDFRYINIVFYMTLILVENIKLTLVNVTEYIT